MKKKKNMRKILNQTETSKNKYQKNPEPERQYEKKI